MTWNNAEHLLGWLVGCVWSRCRVGPSHSILTTYLFCFLKSSAFSSGQERFVRCCTVLHTDSFSPAVQGI